MASVADHSAKSLLATFSLLPECTEQCVAAVVPEFCNSMTDYECRCHSSVKDRLISASMGCISKICEDLDEALEYHKITDQICAALNGDDSDDVPEKTHQDLKKRAPIPAATTSSAAASSTSQQPTVDPDLFLNGSWPQISPAPASSETGTLLAKGPLVGVCIGAPLAGLFLGAVIYKILTRKRKSKAVLEKDASMSHNGDVGSGKVTSARAVEV